MTAPLPAVGVSFFGVAACFGPPLSGAPSPPLPPAACVTVFRVVCVLLQVVDGQVVTVAADVRVATAMQHCHRTRRVSSHGEMYCTRIYSLQYLATFHSLLPPMGLCR